MSAGQRQDSRVAVFVGTSLSHAEARTILPAAVCYPPVARGDLACIDPREVDVVAIIDGVFHQSLAVTPFEIRDLLCTGVEVFGASSMGALRAAELWPLGMHGIGRIFEAYKSGELMSDAEVALVFDPDTYRNLSVPLVNVRYALQQTVSEGRLGHETANGLLALAEQLPYRLLTYQTVLERATDEWFLHGLSRDELVRELTRFDLKKEDTISCLRAIGLR